MRRSAVLAGRLRPPPADRLSWRLAAGDPARRLGRSSSTALFVDPPAATGLPAADRPVHPRARRRSRRRRCRSSADAPASEVALCPAEARSSVRSPTRPPTRTPTAKRRLAAAVEAAPGRDHRAVPPDPRPSRARLRGAPGRGLGRRGARAARLRGRASGGQRSTTAIRATRRGGRGGDGPADRDPRRVRRAARPRSRLRPQHDGRLGRRRRDRPRRDRRRAGGRDRVPRHARGGAGERQGADDRGRPVRRASTRRCCSTPATGTTSSASRSRRRTSRSCSRASRPTPRRIRGRAGTRSTR